MTTLAFDVYPLHGRRIAIQTEIRQLIVAANVAREVACDVNAPSRSFYRLAPALLTQASHIDVLGMATGGAVSPVLLDSPLGTLVSIGSDHADTALLGQRARDSSDTPCTSGGTARALPAYHAAIAKQVCAKPLSRDAWFYDDVAPHWDRLIVRSWLVSTDASDAGHTTPEVYQAGPLSELLPPEELWTHCPPAGAALYGGTLDVHGEPATMRSGETFEIELHDPVLDRRLRHRYALTALPVEA